MITMRQVYKTLEELARVIRESEDPVGERVPVSLVGRKKSGYAKTKRWRETHPEKYRSIQRDLMRRRRASGKED